MITQRYDYKNLTRKNVGGKRLYQTPTGEALPSVTTILDRTKSEEKRAALANWKKRVGTEKAQQITTEAANRGTRMHTYLENYVKDDVFPERATNPFSWASHNMAETVINSGLKNVDEYWGVEVPLYFPGVYAGTTDCVGIHQGTDAIMDFKQSNRPKKEEWVDDYKLQLCAYAEAHNAVYKTEIKKGVILMCVKPKQDDNMNQLEPPLYQEFVIEGEEFELWRQEWWKRVEKYYVNLLNS